MDLSTQVAKEGDMFDGFFSSWLEGSDSPTIQSAQVYILIRVHV